MKKLYFLFAALAGLMLVLSLPHSAVAKKEKKNILLIVADDLGTDALRLYTDKLDLNPNQRAQVPPTPTIDSLAANGVTFDNAWANPACSPTRGTLITGRYGFRTGITRVIGGLPSGETPPVELDVDDPELLPKVLKEKGYRTALIGKWHLTSGFDANDDPNESGFDYWAGFLRGALDPPPIGYYRWPQIIDGGPEVEQNNFATTENVDQAIGFITEPAGTPWFVSLNFAAPHWPYQLPPEELVNDDTPAGMSVYDKVIYELGSYTIPPPPLDLFQRRAIFNAMIYAMDSEIERLLDYVDLDNTCIIFIGDNGTQGRGGPLRPPNNVVVNPFDRTKAKGTLYEGGIRVPMVVYDPEIKKPGRSTNALVNTVDIYAMILKIAGCPSPNRFDGKHFKAVLESPNDDDVSVRNFIYADIERGGFLNQAIRNDRYKIIFNSGEPEFYDLLEDPFEKNDLLLGDRTNKEKSNYKWLSNKLENLLAS